ncbi:MAG: hypothetical protein ACTSWC_01525 [Promethearchaeota archaeon]
MQEKRNLLRNMASLILILGLSSSFLAISLPLIDFTPNNSDVSSTLVSSPLFPDITPHSSDISGNELYAEQLKFNIGGSFNLIQQSYCTNDTNALAGIDLSDPAFSDASFFLSFSNGISPAINPLPINSHNPNFIETSSKSLRLLLYFEGRKPLSTISIQHQRILDILKNQLKIDFFLLNQTQSAEYGYLYEYYGLNPAWLQYFEMTLSNVPQDGYWAALDYDRILSETYLNSQYLQSSLLYLKKYNYLANNINKILKNPIKNAFDLSPLDSSTSIFNIASFQSENSRNSDDSSSSQETTYINRTNNLIFFSLQYEGISNEQNADQKTSYHFDLFNALNYNGSQISISSKCYNSLDGISLSKLDIGLIFGEVTEIEPEIMPFNNQSFSQIENLLFLVDETMDFSFLDDYQFKIKWKTQDSLTMLSTVPINYRNSSDNINFLELLADFPILTTLLNNSIDFAGNLGYGISGSSVAPIEQFHFDYIISSQEPSLQVRKIFQNGQPNNVFDIENTPEINLTVSNENNITVWGQEVNLTVLGISNDPTNPLSVLGLDQNIFELLGYDTNFILNVLETLGYNIEDLFHNDNPRFFMLDLNNSGEFDSLYPNLLDLNINRFLPYSPEFTQILIDNSDAFGNIAINPQIWNSSESIFNSENWKLEPGESFSLSLQNGLNNIDDKFASIQSFVVSVEDPHLPIIAIGHESSGTAIQNTFSNADHDYWDIKSESYGQTNQIQLYLFFDNQTELLHILNDSIDLNAIFLDSILKSSEENTDYQLQIYNHASHDVNGDGFETLGTRTIGNEMEWINFTLSDNNYNLSEYWNIDENVSILFRVSFQNDVPFHIFIDYLQVEFQDRLNQYIFFNQSSVQYCSRFSNNQYFSFSNTLLASTSQSAIINAISQISVVDPTKSLYLLNISLVNNGLLPAYNLTARILQMGLIANLSNHSLIEMNNHSVFQSHAGNFTFIDGVLLYNISTLESGASISNISLLFYLTNSFLTPSLNVTWKNRILYNETNRLQLFISYQDFISKPLYYNISSLELPIHQLSFQYFIDHDYPSYNINDNISIFVKIDNLKPTSVFGVKIKFISPNEGWRLLNSTKILTISEFKPFESQLVKLIYQKTSVRGYLIPSEFEISSEEDSFLQVQFNSLLMIGNFGLTIKKQISNDALIMGDIVEISLEIINTGNVPLGNISINDADSYVADAFQLYEGLTLYDIDFLGVNQSFKISYTLQSLRTKGIFSIRPATTLYYFGISHEIQSNSFSVKIQEPYGLIILKILGPIFIGAAALVMIYKYKLRYSREDFEYQRREKLLFGKSLRETSWHRRNLTEFLNEQNIGGEDLHE